MNKFIFCLLLFLISLASCNGQNKTQALVFEREQTTNSNGHAKLIKTQGSNQYQSIRCGLQDKFGNLWFGTSEEGVYKYDGKLFTQFTKKDGLISNSIFSILEDKAGNIWFGTTDGICLFDGKQITPISIPFAIRPIITNNSYYNDWSTKSTVWSMRQDKSGTIWFGTGDGVYCYNGFGFSRFLNNDGVINKDSLHLKLISDILEDKNGIIWFASGMPPGYEGLCRYDGKMIERFKPQNEGWIRNLIESKNGNLLLATRHFGVWTYDGKSFSDYAQPKELIKPSLNYILEDKAGNLWVASDYGKEMGDTLGGLWHANISTDKTALTTFTKIFNKEVYFMLEDKNKHIWFSTRGVGLYRFDGKTVSKFSE
jgi:ligand-binding sensor domain-containing protein